MLLSIASRCSLKLSSRFGAIFSEFLVLYCLELLNSICAFSLPAFDWISEYWSSVDESVWERLFFSCKSSFFLFFFRFSSLGSLSTWVDDAGSIRILLQIIWTCWVSISYKTNDANKIEIKKRCYLTRSHISKQNYIN